MLLVDEVAPYLRVDRKTLYAEIREGRFPAVRLGRTVRIPREGLLRWLETQGRVVPPGGPDGTT